MAKDRTKNYARPFSALGHQVSEFNKVRAAEFGRGPQPEARLPIPFTMVGADIPDEWPSKD